VCGVCVCVCGVVCEFVCVCGVEYGVCVLLCVCVHALGFLCGVRVCLLRHFPQKLCNVSCFAYNNMNLLYNPH